MPLGFDLDAGSIPDFGDFHCNGNYAAGTTNADRGETPLHYYVYVWDIRDGSGPEILDVLDSDNGIGAFAFITNENELIVRSGGYAGGPTATTMRIYDAANFTLLQSIPIAPYLTDDDINSGFYISEVTVAGIKYLFVQVTPYLGGFRGPYLILKRVGGAWVYDAHHVSDGTTITGYTGISAGTQYAYLRGTTTVGLVQWLGGYSEALITPSIGAASILYVTYIPASDEVLVITGGIAVSTVEALVYSPDLSTLKRSATVWSGISGGLRNTDSGGMLLDATVAAIPIVTWGSFHISNFVLFDVITMTVTLLVDVDPVGDYVNQNNPYNYCVINDENTGAGVMPAGAPQHLSFWPFPYVPVVIEPEPEPELPDVCPIEGVGIDECIVGQTSLPVFICGMKTVGA